MKGEVHGEGGGSVACAVVIILLFALHEQILSRTTCPASARTLVAVSRVGFVGCRECQGQNW